MSLRKQTGEFQRKGRDGWAGQLSLGKMNGKRVRRTLYAPTLEELRAKMAAAREDAKRGVVPSQTRQTVTEFFEHWLENVHRPSVRPSTYKLTQYLLKHALPLIGAEILGALSDQHVASMLTSLSAKGASPSMRCKVLNAVSSGLEAARRTKRIATNPCHDVKRPRVEQRELTPWDAEQARAFLRAAQSDRLHALYAVLLHCGVRTGEAFALRWEDVDLARATLSVNASLSLDRDGELKRRSTKTKAGRRSIPMSPNVVHALHAHQERMLGEGFTRSNCEWVFPDSDGNVLRKDNVRNRSFLPLVKAAGVPRIRMHDLRHTCASLLLAEGVHPKVVQSVLGHAKVSMTLDTYSHLLPSMASEAADAMQSLALTGTKPSRLRAV